MVPADLRHRLHQTYEECIQEILGDIPKQSVLSSYLARRGRDMRGLFFLAAWNSCGAELSDEALRTGAALEMMHDFVLIHDDIIDEGKLRRFAPALWRQIGRNRAMVTGDFLYAASLRLFNRAPVSAQARSNALDVLLGAAEKTALGELREQSFTGRSVLSLSAADLFELYDLKTGWYSFYAPLAAGLICAGAGRESRMAVERIAFDLGRAFQLRDDTADLLGSVHMAGKDSFTDLCRAIPTVPLRYLSERARQDHNNGVLSVLRGENICPDAQELLASYAEECGLEEYVNQICSGAKKRAEIVFSDHFVPGSAALCHALLDETLPAEMNLYQ
ncbi:MAG: polyprenyl synthetase family protein [Fibrobacterota bacterium]